MTKIINNQGQSLLEVILALAIFALVAAALITMSTGGFASLVQGGRQIEASALAQEGVEAVRAIRDRAWNELTVVTSTVTTTNGQWMFGNEGATETIGDYTRVVHLEDVCRDGANVMTACPGVYNDVATKKLISEVFWSPRANVTTSVKQVTYLTDWDENLWQQTDWVGGAGQNIWSDTAKFFNNDGGVDASSTGQLQLLYTESGQCGPMVWDFASADRYVYDSSKIEVVGGFGELKDIGSCSGSTSTCSGLLSQSACQTQTGCNWSVGYYNAGASINNRRSYHPMQIAYWSGFVETAIKNGGEIYYQLSNDDGATWKYWNGSIWATSTIAADYNTAGIVNDNIAHFPTSTKKIMFKAFLSGNGLEQVKLDQVQINCTRKNDTTFDNAGDYQYDNSVISVSGGAASLRDIGGASTCSGTALVCDTFLSAGACGTQMGCAWTDGSSGATTNSGFDTNTAGWTYYDWENPGKASGTHQNKNGHPGGYVNINLSAVNNSTVSGYWQQSFATDVANPTADLSFDWYVRNFSANDLVSYTLYVFVDDFSGSPVVGTEVWSQTIHTASSWASISGIDVSSKITSAGTYYLKLAARRITEGGKGGTLTNGFDNALLNWSKTAACSGVSNSCDTMTSTSTCTAQSGCSWTSGGTSYSTVSPTISPVYSLSVPTATFYGWTGFVETASTSGGSINYQLSNDDGATWKYWDGSTWSAAGANNYNLATVVNSQISSFPTSTGKLLFKAFLVSNGSQSVRLDNISTTWMENVGTSGYAAAGTVMSSAFDMLNSSPLSIISWAQDTSTCSNCAVKLQLRTAPNNAGVPGAWSSWYGSAGPGTYFTTSTGSVIPKDLNWNQWMQYQVQLVGDTNTTPILKDIFIYYK